MQLIKVYNKLFKELVKEDCDYKFINKIRKLLITECHYYTDEYFNDRQ